MVQDLHHVRIVHGDLEPWHIGRVKGGGLCLVNFSASYKHICNETKVSLY